MELRQYEKVLGFDARVMWIPKEGLWNESRLETFAWRKDTPRIFSTDEIVWPQLLNGFVPGPEGEITWEGPEEPESWIGPNRPYWAHLKELEQYLDEYSGSLPGLVWIVALTCVAKPSIMARRKGGLHLGDEEPSFIDPSWSFLGYDVSDAGSISGLTNCGSSTNEAPPHWIVDLNENHLFQSIDIADEFRQFIDVQVKEHSPFVICGLYKIKELIPTLPFPNKATSLP